MVASLPDILRQALAHHQCGRLAEAVATYRAVLDRESDHPEANYNLGVALAQLGQAASGLPYFRRAATVAPGNPQFRAGLAECCRCVGQLDEAGAILEQARNEGMAHPALTDVRNRIDAARNAHAGAEVLPGLIRLFQAGDWSQLERVALAALDAHGDNGAVWHFLGLARLHAGRPDEAIPALARAGECLPGDPVVLLNLGLAHQKSGAPDAAIAAYARAIALNPHYFEAHINRGSVLQALGRLPEAIECYRLAIAIQPDFAAAHNNLGCALQETGEFTEALEAYRRAIAIQPDYAGAHYNLGNAYMVLGRLDEAAGAFRQTLALQPGNAGAHNNLGAVLRDLGRQEEALESFRRAQALDPQSAAICCNIGDMLKDLGRDDAAAEHYRRAHACEPENIDWLLVSEAARLMPIVEDLAQIDAQRSALAKALEKLPATEGEIRKLEEVRLSFFYLAYHGRDDRPLMEQVASLVREKAARLLSGADVPAPPPAGDGRIRVGFVSSLLHAHTIGKLTQGYVQCLDRSRFHVTVIHAPGGRRDKVRDVIDTAADRVVELPNSLVMAWRSMAALQLDVLYYPDIGMVPFTYFLAYARLAPVQAVSWGHPVTTGLSSLDYFLSFDAAEPEGAEAAYTERLVRLQRPPTYYQPFFRPERVLPRDALGLPDHGRLYGCPQSLFKFHPDFDAVLAEILARDPDGWIVAVEGSKRFFHERLRARWARRFPVLTERVLFLPRMPQDRFMMLLANMDVLLDPPHFGSGNTFYESMVSGVPSVTWPGAFMRGRIVAGTYRWLGIDNPPVAACLGDYAALAVRVAADVSWRTSLRTQLLEKAPRLFRDEGSVRELEAFFETAVAAARSGTIAVGQAAQ